MQRNANHSDESFGQRLLGRKAGARYLGLSQRKYDTLVGRGAIPIVRIPGVRRVAADINDLDAVVESWKRKPAAEHEAV